MTDRLARIRYLQGRRAFFNKLGKRKKVVMIDAELVPLMTEEMAIENLAVQVRQDIEWIGAGERGNNRRVA